MPIASTRRIWAGSTNGFSVRVSMTMLQPMQTKPKGSSHHLRQRHKSSGNGLKGMMSQLKLVTGSDEKTIR